ncbi:MAG: hypothetical protein J5833_05480, partial [Victivallales bacterium]|nr:hypothetical protein [Victivallales bacterium]
MALLTAVASAFEIKTRENAPAYERTAAEELRGYLAKLVAPGGKVTVNGKTIDAFYVGDTEFAGTHGMASSQFAEEAWRIRAFEGNVVLNGGGSRGALYAVFHFLEDFCGVRWMTFDEEYVPAPVGTLSLPPLDVSGKPKLLYRCIYAASNLDKELGMQVVRHAVRNRMNHLGDYRIPSEWGGGFDYGTPYHCHTMDDYYVPAKDYLATKPELFSLLNGKRVGGQFVGQLCLSNPEVYEI